MANKRSLKQAINLICEELFAEAVAASLYGNEPHKENGNAQALLSSIVRLQADYTSRISHVEPGMKATDYFKSLREKFTSEVDEMVDQINNL
jgi:hypothetical protein